MSRYEDSKMLNTNEILEKYKISRNDLAWIGSAYSFKNGKGIPEEFLDDLVICTITTKYRENLGSQDRVSFMDYKYTPVTINLNVTSYVPTSNLELIKQTSLKLSEKKIRQMESEDFAETMDFRCDNTVLMYHVSGEKALSSMKRTPDEIAQLKAKVAAHQAELEVSTTNAK